MGYKTGPPNCTERSVEQVDRFTSQLAGDVLNLLCTEYDEDSDKCSKMITPKRRKDQKRTKSFLRPLIDLLLTIE